VRLRKQIRRRLLRRPPRKDETAQGVAARKAARATSQLGDADRLIADLRLLDGAAEKAPLVCGPFVGEIGFETLYWIPFLARLLESPALEERRAVVMSRGGAEELYRRLPRPQRIEYVDVVDLLGADEFLAFERQRIGDDPRRKNQKAASEFESALVEQAGLSDAVQVRPAQMFRMLKRHPVERVLAFPWRAAVAEREELTVAKFWFGGQFPATDDNLAFLRRRLVELMSSGPVVAIDNAFTLELNAAVDDPFRAVCRDVGVPTMSTTSYRTNLAEQIELVARASRLVATYGGFSYLGLYTGTEIESYYSSPRTVFTRHFVTLSYALGCLNGTKAGRELRFSLVGV
jgi:hypothetical protein